MTAKPIIALDFSTYEAAKEFLAGFDETLYVKVGMELYMQSGPAIIDVIKSLWSRCLFRLKTARYSDHCRADDVGTRQT